ncbi:Tetratricopeptide repeat protein [Pirellula sp. SH-Sr6A]|uniref:tetratricopeptide repeat protein n=1 Tax=Pirellula sp. SH-Sr6A TaxID=1632865 RepID=UPI00078BA8BD|nr:tetratricopeptide repeat protein [Pirellula sp. SH-Sr6A]AMV34603.1 Tetratricopeptide repeat protein [Pirellula sp. SH-Sr6A]
MMIERVETVGPMVTDTPGASTFDVSPSALGALGMSKHQLVPQKNRIAKLLVGCLHGLVGTAFLCDMRYSHGQGVNPQGPATGAALREGPFSLQGVRQLGAPVAGDLSASPWSSRLSSPPLATVRWGSIQPIDQAPSNPPVAMGAVEEPRRIIPTRTVSNSGPMSVELSAEKPTSVTIANPWVVSEPPTDATLSELFPYTNAAPTGAATPVRENAIPSSREQLAQRVSENLLQPDYSRSVRRNSGPPPRALERPAGWSALEGELRSALEQCDQLLRRGAVHSARDEVVLGLRKLMRTMDAIRGAYVSEPALDKALQAMREELDFLSVSHGVTVESIVATHSTDVLKNRSLQGVSPAVASQHYRSFARYQFLLGADEHPWAADLLYALGKTLEKEAEANSAASLSLRSQAVICYQAAIHVQSNHPEASNQLGYSLLLLDRVDEALVALNRAVQLNPSSSSWANLAEAYKRSGALEQSSVAAAKASEWQRAERPGYSRSNPEVIEISPEEFARFSPAQNSYSSTTNPTAPSPTAIPPVATQSNRTSTPVQSAGRFSNLFR